MKKLLTWLGLSLLLVTLVACSTANPSSTAKEEVPLSSKPTINGFVRVRA